LGRSRETLAQQLDVRQLGGRGRLIAPAHHPAGIDHDKRALGKAALVQNAKRGAGGPLGLEVRQLRDADSELLPEGLLRPGAVAGDPVDLLAICGELLEAALIELQLVGADGAESERIEDEDRGRALKIALAEALPVFAHEPERRRRAAGVED